MSKYLNKIIVIALCAFVVGCSTGVGVGVSSGGRTNVSVGTGIRL